MIAIGGLSYVCDHGIEARGPAQGKRVTMKAIVVGQYGGSEVLKLKEVEIGEPEPGQARIRIGVNFVDIYQRRGTYPRQLPDIPGLEGAGLWKRSDKMFSSVKPGDRVAYVSVWREPAKLSPDS